MIGKTVEFWIGGAVADTAVVQGVRSNHKMWCREVLVKAEGENWWVPVTTIQPADNHSPSAIVWGKDE